MSSKCRKVIFVVIEIEMNIKRIEEITTHQIIVAITTTIIIICGILELIQSTTIIIEIIIIIWVKVIQTNNMIEDSLAEPIKIIFIIVRVSSRILRLCLVVD